MDHKIGSFRGLTAVACLLLIVLPNFLWGQRQMEDLNRGIELLFADDFEQGLDSDRWIAEIEPLPESKVHVHDGKLILDTQGGVTVWLNMLLKGNIQIEFTRKVILDGGKNDRVSDLNQFWMAKDIRNPDLFTRTGAFTEYDSLRLYYAGIGGNTNTTTRFRKYNGNGEKILLQEHTDSDHLLLPNKEYRIKIIVKDSVTSLWVDDIRYFTYHDADPLLEGYFGFRSTWSRQEIDDFKIYRLY